MVAAGTRWSTRAVDSFRRVEPLRPTNEDTRHNALVVKSAHLVGDHEQVGMASDDVSDGLNLSPSEDLARGVVRRVEHEQLGLRGDLYPNRERKEYKVRSSATLGRSI